MAALAAARGRRRDGRAARGATSKVLVAVHEVIVECDEWKALHSIEGMADASCNVPLG